MRSGDWFRLLAIVLGFCVPSPAVQGAAKLPVVDGKEAVARVNGEPIFLADLLDQLASLHQGVAEPQAKVHRPDPQALLDRLINVRLILQEARNIGLDEQPEVAGQLDTMRMQVIRGLLAKRVVNAVAEPDPDAVSRIYRDLVREWKVGSVLFEREDDARGFAAAVENGGDFDGLAKEVKDTGAAKGAEVGKYERATNFRPEVAEVLKKLKVGEVGGPVKLDNGYAILKLVDERYPDDPKAQEQAEAMVLQGRQQDALHTYMEDLRERYVTVDQKVFDTLDFDAGPENLDRLRKDDRVVATVKGSGQVTVADLTAAVEKKFYHGIESAMERKRVDEEAPGILDKMLLERAALVEAKKYDLENTDAYKDAMREQLNGLLFASFIKKVVNPDIKITEQDLRRYYDEHVGDYTSPEMLRIDGLAFARRADAEAALGRLRQGTELRWIRENAEGQATRDQFPGLLTFGGMPLAVPTLPEGVQKALAGAAPGDDRFYAAPDGPYYILHVRDRIAPEPRPYEAVRKELGPQLAERKQEEALKDWGQKLRAASEIEVFATARDLDEILGLRFAAGDGEASAENRKNTKGKQAD